MTTAQAAPDQAISPVSSYRDLLDPIPNAFAKLKADDEATQARRQNPSTKLTQISVQVGHYHHHHHHHHAGVGVKLGPVHHHHHHHPMTAPLVDDGLQFNLERNRINNEKDLFASNRRCTA
jgi:hypothetical protein